VIASLHEQLAEALINNSMLQLENEVLSSEKDSLKNLTTQLISEKKADVKEIQDTVAKLKESVEYIQTLRVQLKDEYEANVGLKDLYDAIVAEKNILTAKTKKLKSHADDLSETVSGSAGAKYAAGEEKRLLKKEIDGIKQELADSKKEVEKLRNALRGKIETNVGIAKQLKISQARVLNLKGRLKKKEKKVKDAFESEVSADSSFDIPEEVKSTARTTVSPMSLPFGPYSNVIWNNYLRWLPIMNQYLIAQSALQLLSKEVEVLRSSKALLSQDLSDKTTALTLARTSIQNLEKELALKELLFKIGVTVRLAWFESNKRIRYNGSFKLVPGRSEINHDLLRQKNEAVHRGNFVVDKTLVELGFLSKSQIEEFKYAYDALPTSAPRSPKIVELIDLRGSLVTCGYETEWTHSKTVDEDMKKKMREARKAWAEIVKRGLGDEETVRVAAVELEPRLVVMRKIAQDVFEKEMKRMYEK
jgi:hypothetical protein